MRHAQQRPAELPCDELHYNHPQEAPCANSNATGADMFTITHIFVHSDDPGQPPASGAGSNSAISSPTARLPCPPFPQPFPCPRRVLPLLACCGETAVPRSQKARLQVHWRRQQVRMQHCRAGHEKSDKDSARSRYGCRPCFCRAHHLCN